MFAQQRRLVYNHSIFIYPSYLYESISSYVLYLSIYIESWCIEKYQMFTHKCRLVYDHSIFIYLSYLYESIYLLMYCIYLSILSCGVLRNIKCLHSNAGQFIIILSLSIYLIYMNLYIFLCIVSIYSILSRSILRNIRCLHSNAGQFMIILSLSIYLIYMNLYIYLCIVSIYLY